MSVRSSDFNKDISNNPKLTDFIPLSLISYIRASKGKVAITTNTGDIWYTACNDKFTINHIGLTGHFYIE